MTQDEKYKIISNDYVDLLIEYNRNFKLLNRYPDATTHIMNSRYAIAYAPVNILSNNFFKSYGYAPLPRCFGLTSKISIEASGIERLRTLPAYNLKGSGVLVAIIDTGIDYTNPIFIREDGTSKIVALWDQTIDSEDQFPDNSLYGTEYTSELINLALQSSNPYETVPSRDEIGHGTMLAGVLVGSEVRASDFSGIVPEADIIVVKLKQAKKNIRDFWMIPADIPCYQENDILWAIQYIIETFVRLRRPCSICIGLGTSQGPHNASRSLDSIISTLSDLINVSYSISAGNEGAANSHYYGVIDAGAPYNIVELNIGEGETGFSMELWGSLPNTYSIDILSPSGEYIPRITESLREARELNFIFEETTISVNYHLVESLSGEQLILLRFRKPTPGIWTFKVYTRGDSTGSFHIWLPMSGFISTSTYFVSSDPYTTITSPGNSLSPITVTAYNPVNEALYLKASKGYTRNLDVKPDLAAPGVNIVVPTLTKEFTVATGTGLAAAHTAGICAIMMEWGIVRGFYPEMDSTVIKKYLIRGAKRSKSLEYPNKDWGYGIIDLYNVFNTLRTNFPGIQ